MDVQAIIEEIDNLVSYCTSDDFDNDRKIELYFKLSEVEELKEALIFYAQRGEAKA